MPADLKNEYRQVRFRCNETDLPTSFFVITAFNPDGVTVDDLANQRADEQLSAEIGRLGHTAFRVTGGSADFIHAEPGYGLACTREEVLTLARRFRQQAVFEMTNGRVLLVSALPTAGEPEVIGSWVELLIGNAENPGEP